MGSSESAPPPERPPSPALKKPWRGFSWSDREENLESLNDFQLEEVEHLRILLYGPVGAGKSSFINSVSSVLQGCLAPLPATSAATSGDSFTRKYKTYKITKGGASETYPFVFSDMEGLEQEGNSESVVEDIRLIMQGHMMDDYKFNTTPLTEDDKYYKKDPSPGDKVHVVVCVLSANTTAYEASVVQQMQKVRGIARDMGVPEVVILTNIDEACDVTEDDLKDVYLSKHLKQKMEDFSSRVGFPVSCMFPVKNYSRNVETNNDADVLILSALKRMIDVGNNFINEITA